MRSRDPFVCRREIFVLQRLPVRSQLYVAACALVLAIAGVKTVGSSPGSTNAITQRPGQSATSGAQVGITSDLEPSWYKGASKNVHGDFRYPYVHKPHNNVVDSVYHLTVGHNGSGYYGVVDYKCSAPNIVNPRYVWSNSGSPESHTLIHPNVEEVVSDFGHNWATDQVKSTVETVTVTGKDGEVGTDTYTVNWHAPVEHWHVTSGHEIAPIPDDVSSGLQTAGSAGLIGITSPDWVWSANGIDGSLLSLILPHHPITYYRIGDANQFKQDVARQIKIDNGSITDVFEPNIARMSKELANAAHASGNYKGYVESDNGDMFFYDVRRYVRRWKRDYTGDTYAADGYTGSVTGSTRNDGMVDYVYTWTLHSMNRLTR